MKRTLLTLSAALITAAGFSSCASGPNAQMGTGIGALSGAALGGVIGHQSGRGLEGALIGGAAGGLIGNQIGGSQDQRNQEYYHRQQQQRRYNGGYGY